MCFLCTLLSNVSVSIQEIGQRLRFIKQEVLLWTEFFLLLQSPFKTLSYVFNIRSNFKIYNSNCLPFLISQALDLSWFAYLDFACQILSLSFFRIGFKIYHLLRGDFICLFNFLLLFYDSCPNFPLLLSPTLGPPTPHSQSPPFYPCPWVIYTCSLMRPFPFFPPLSLTLLPSGPCQSVPRFHASAFLLLVCLFCWLGSTYRWDHMVFVFHHLAYFT